MSSCAAETSLVAMDCLVVCCCCPCLVLQVTVLLLVRLPRKVVVKTKRIILRRWHRRRPAPAEEAVAAGCPASAGFKLAELVDLSDGFEGAFGIGEGCTDGARGYRQRCFAVDDDNDDGAWEALVEQEGLFWFGSFWGRPKAEEEAPASGDDGAFRLPVALERVCASA